LVRLLLFVPGCRRLHDSEVPSSQFAAAAHDSSIAFCLDGRLSAAYRLGRLTNLVPHSITTPPAALPNTRHGCCQAAEPLQANNSRSDRFLYPSLPDRPSQIVENNQPPFQVTFLFCFSLPSFEAVAAERALHNSCLTSHDRAS
jgi:hypothetical protein